LLRSNLLKNNPREKEMETIKLEAFNANLHGCRVLCQGPFPKHYPPIMESIQKLREPFKKKILLTNTPFGISKYLPMAYDTVFHMKDAADWTLLLTYITYAPKPVLVVSEDIVIPDGLWPKITRQTTFVNFTNSLVFSGRPYDAIFFAPMEDVSGMYTDYVFKLLQSLYRASYSMKEHKEIIQELRIASAGLMWSKVDEESQGGCVCWYDPTPSQTGDRLTSNQMAEVLIALAGQMRS
jgi:hypothetical protein